MASSCGSDGLQDFFSVYAAIRCGLARTVDGMVGRMLNGRLDGMLDGMFGRLQSV